MLLCQLSSPHNMLVLSCFYSSIANQVRTQILPQFTFLQLLSSTVLIVVLNNDNDQHQTFRLVIKATCHEPTIATIPRYVLALALLSTIQRNSSHRHWHVCCSMFTYHHSSALCPDQIASPNHLHSSIACSNALSNYVLVFVPVAAGRGTCAPGRQQRGRRKGNAVIFCDTKYTKIL